MTDYNEELRQLEERKKTIEFQKVLPSKERARITSGINKDIKEVNQDIKVEAKAQAVWERQRGKEVKAIGGTATGALKGGAKIGLTVIKGLGKIAFRKGVRHPDSLIDPKARFLYLPTNPKMTPLGHFMDNPMELYFGSKRTRGVPPSARVVLSALQQGASIEQLEVVTSLSPQEINQSLRYLVDKKLIDKEVLE